MCTPGGAGPGGCRGEGVQGGLEAAYDAYDCMMRAGPCVDLHAACSCGAGHMQGR